MTISHSDASSILQSSKKYQSYIGQLQWFMLLLALFSASFAEDYTAYVAIVIFLVEVVVLAFRLRAYQKKRLGQLCSRTAILTNALGVSNAIADSYIKSQITNEETNRATAYSDSSFYATRAEKGLKRLKEVVSENCFWTKFLYDKMADKLMMFLVIYLLGYIVLLVLVLSTDGLQSGIPWDKIAILLISAAPLKDGLVDIFKFKNSSRVLKSLDESLSNFSDNDDQTLLIFSDYSVATSEAPLIPESVYDKHKNRLNELWRQRSS